MVRQEQWEVIRSRHAGGQSVSSIARDLGLDRKTVRACLKRQAWAPYSRSVKRASLLDEYMDWLRRRAPQVAFSARILHQVSASGIYRPTWSRHKSANGRAGSATPESA